MPCRDDRDDDCDYVSISTDELAATNSAIEKRTYLLCEACTLLEEVGLLDKTSEELRNWYKIHELLEADKVRLEAAQKLTKREQRLLGIDLKDLEDKVK